MESVKVKILGISGTPIKGGNCDTLIQEALKGAAEVGEVVGGVETEFITLADKKIAMCKHCQWCVEHKQMCNVKDDAIWIADKITEADGLILGGPAWCTTLAPPLTILYSRFRYIYIFTHNHRNKPVGAVTLGYFGVGLERALSVIEGFTKGMYVGGAYAIASKVAFGQRAGYLEHGVLDDVNGVRKVKNLAMRVVEVARMVRYAKDHGITLPPEYMRGASTGGKIRQDKKFVDGAWR